MSIKDLNSYQLQQVKQRYYIEKNMLISYYDLAFIDDIVSDDEIIEYYKDTYFVPNDFN